MRPVVADTGPLHYLVLIDAIDILPMLFGRVLIPEIVAVELSHPATPSAVRTFLHAAPPWLERRPEHPISLGVGVTPQRDAGERAAIGLAQLVGAHLLLIDDRAGDAAARARGLETIGTIGLLVRATRLGLVDLRGAFTRLRETNFRCRPELLDTLLAQHEVKKP
jgi:predicted nucleic acid-binding protein